MNSPLNSTPMPERAIPEPLRKLTRAQKEAIIEAMIEALDLTDGDADFEDYDDPDLEAEDDKSVDDDPCDTLGWAAEDHNATATIIGGGSGYL